MPMNVTSPRMIDIARVYRVSRQRIHEMRKTFALAPQDFADPERIFNVLLDHSVACPMRDRLTDPAERARIRNQLAR